jgi:transposase-like protein
MARSRTRRSAKEKLQIIKECQQSGASVSEVCRRHGIATTQYYQWLKQAEAAAVEAFQNGKRETPSRREQRQQAELERMRAVIAEITAENLELKKTLGG